MLFLLPLCWGFNQGFSLFFPHLPLLSNLPQPTFPVTLTLPPFTPLPIAIAYVRKRESCVQKLPLSLFLSSSSWRSIWMMRMRSAGKIAKTSFTKE